MCLKSYQNVPNHTKTVIFYHIKIGLQFTCKSVLYSPIFLVGAVGFEPTAPCSQSIKMDILIYYF